MDGAGSMRGMRYNFDAMKKELVDSMTLCDLQDDQYHRVMNTITEILYKAIECVQARKQFNASNLIYAAFNVMDTAERPIHPQEMVFFKFARTFILFMDNLNGFCTVSKVLEMNEPISNLSPYIAMGHKHKLSANKNKTAPVQQSLKRARLCPAQPDRSVAASRQTIPRYVVVKPEQANRRQPVATTSSPLLFDPEMEIKTEDEMCEPEDFCSGNMSDAHNVPGCSKDTIKEEVVDPDEVSPHDPLPMNGLPYVIEAEIKKEEIEEPIEEPIADTIRVPGMPSTSRQFVTKIRKTLRGDQCPFCDVLTSVALVDKHIKVTHRRIWAERAKKCPDAGCDFFAVLDSTMVRHCKATHNAEFQKWKYTRRFLFPIVGKKVIMFSVGTACPYCPKLLADVKELVEHLQTFHSELFSINETRFLVCRACKFTAARMYQMYTHWLERGEKCKDGLHFNYSASKRSMNAANAARLKYGLPPME